MQTNNPHPVDTYAFNHLKKNYSLPGICIVPFDWACSKPKIPRLSILGKTFKQSK